MATSGPGPAGAPRPGRPESRPLLRSAAADRTVDITADVGGRPAEPQHGWVALTSPQQRDGLHVELLCGHCGVLLMLDGRRYDEHLWVGAEVLCHLCGSVNPVPQALVFERN